MDLKKIVEDAIVEYNRYRSPEVEARLMSISENKIEIEFGGSICYTCGFYDYFEDYRIILEEMGLKTVISSIEEVDEKAIVAFSILEFHGASTSTEC
ncbi:hypothetical protein KEJ29_01730 [Candidatus Bathyarchaeota archaeon]|nr:hypothetical protein [Candidatus Bathyarchaeota archaeon]